ncbi:hypothetical protein [Demequina maris]|uniref:hypothetical protein n=1 Tax=Demequina maris TaxID=1638982 RepID=UPI000780D015|nr:hypothetical protein [Demequina maris]
MRTVVVILVGIVLVGIGWFWWRGSVVEGSPAVHAAADVPLPVVTGPYEAVASDCREGVAWESTHTRRWQSLAQEYAGTVDACMEVYRMTTEGTGDAQVGDGDSSSDYYVAVVTAAWSRDDREDLWWPWDGGDDAPSPVTIAVTTDGRVLDNVYEASRPARVECVSSIPDAPVLLDGADLLATPTFVAGSCGGTIAAGPITKGGASWTVTRPEEFDLTVTSFRIKVAEGARPNFELQVAPSA